MTHEEIKTAIDNGNHVFWQSAMYEVTGNRKNGYLIRCRENGHCIGLHGMEGTKYENVLNGKEKDFYVIITEVA